MVDEITLQRLAFVRYLYRIGIDQSYQPEPMSAVSILTLRDSVELFLQLASESINAGESKTFEGYWGLPKLSDIGLTQREPMRRLNKARVALKHYGTMPSKLDIEAFRSSATNFLEENSRLVFKTEFSSISLLHLVKCPTARDSLAEASKLMGENKTDDAMDKIATGFAQLVDDYEGRKAEPLGRSPFFFGESLAFDYGERYVRENKELARYLDKLRKSIGAMQEALKVLSLGLDYRKYIKFHLLVPEVDRLLSGEYLVHRWPRETPFQIQACNFCFDFVIESALSLQRSDFDVQLDKNLRRWPTI